MYNLLLKLYVRNWHRKFKKDNKNWYLSSMYTNGQYDDIPYFQFEEFIANLKRTFKIV